MNIKLPLCVHIYVPLRNYENKRGNQLANLFSVWLILSYSCSHIIMTNLAIKMTNKNTYMSIYLLELRSLVQYILWLKAQMALPFQPKPAVPSEGCRPPQAYVVGGRGVKRAC